LRCGGQKGSAAEPLGNLSLALRVVSKGKSPLRGCVSQRASVNYLVHSEFRVA